MSLQRWLFSAHMEESLKAQKEGLGFSDKDLDDVRRLITDTSTYLLVVTVVASLLHLIFEMLAFQSDIAFWRSTKSLVGLSLRQLVSDLVSQFVVFLFLLDSDTSPLVTIPACFGLLVQAWKVQKAMGLRIKWMWRVLPMGFYFETWQEVKRKEGTDEKKENEEESSDALSRVSLEADRIATNFIYQLLSPVALCFILRSLLFDKHAGWYSFAISSLTGCVYSFGFVFMLPQLWINHKLKSVSHLPWRMLAYKFVNTFIDDLFSFIIKMPTMHRLSVFRDDIVFIVYLYQRYIYRVDSSRPIEK